MYDFEHMKKKAGLVTATLVSVIVMGFALSLLNLVNLGTDPFTFMNLSIAEKFGITLGNWQLFLNVMLFIPVILWGRKQIGPGTVFNMVLVGYCVDFFAWIWTKTGFASLFDDMATRILLMLPALAIFILSAAVYMSTDLGTAPYDALPFMISKRITKISFQYIRLCWDFLAILIGFIISGRLGIVTILMALFMGRTVTVVKMKVDGIFKKSSQS